MGVNGLLIMCCVSDLIHAYIIAQMVRKVNSHKLKLTKMQEKCPGWGILVANRGEISERGQICSCRA